MDHATLYWLIAGSFILNCIIIYYIIYASTETSKKLWYMEKQMRLLMLIARKQGATEEEVNEIFN